MLWIVGRAIPSLLSIVIKVGNITLPPFVFARKPPSAATVVHEEIHGKQTMETVLAVSPVLAVLAVWTDSLGLALLVPVLAVLFHLVVVYGAVWLVGVVRLLLAGEALGDVGSMAYFEHPMELECYRMAVVDRKPNVTYLATRPAFAWVAFMRGG